MDNISRFLGNFQTQILNPLVILLFFLAFVYFWWGIAMMIKNSGSPDGRTTGKNHIIYGLIGMFIMLSAFGIMNLICGTISC